MKNDVIDVEVKDVKIEQFLTEKKELVLNAAQRTVEAYLEVGKHLKEVNEKLAISGSHNSRWKTWLEEIGFEKKSALNAISVFERYGSGEIDFTRSTTILIELSRPSNDPEKVALVEQKLAKGEKMTVAQVKEALKKLPEVEREIISQASYEIAEEERDEFVEEQTQVFNERHKGDAKTKKLAEAEAKVTFADRTLQAKDEFEEIQVWIENAQQFYLANGVTPPEFKLEGNLIYNI